jgi:hypothetical protein
MTIQPGIRRARCGDLSSDSFTTAGSAAGPTSPQPSNRPEILIGHEPPIGAASR